MAFRSVESPDNISGRILLFRMPGRFEPFGEFLEQAARMGVTDVLCLTPMEEIAVKSPEYHRAIRAGGLPFQWHQIGIPDYGTPADPEGFRAEIEEVSSRLSRGAVVLVHCAVGIQRTGLVAVCLLQSLGVPYEEALGFVTYAGSEPSMGQRSFAKSFSISEGKGDAPSDLLLTRRQQELGSKRPMTPSSGPPSVPEKKRHVPKRRSTFLKTVKL
jgi:hypothetical protein